MQQSTGEPGYGENWTLRTTKFRVCLEQIGEQSLQTWRKTYVLILLISWDTKVIRYVQWLLEIRKDEFTSQFAISPSFSRTSSFSNYKNTMKTKKSLICQCGSETIYKCVFHWILDLSAYVLIKSGFIKPATIATPKNISYFEKKVWVRTFLKHMTNPFNSSCKKML